MDRIIVLDEGKIVEEGSHKDLLRLEHGTYAKPVSYTHLDVYKRQRIHRGEIRFVDVNFKYEEDERRPLFKDFNLRIKPGEKVGLVGRSGGGKSSLARLLSRFMDVESGQILIDGQDITHIRQRSLRKHIAYVPQDPLLFLSLIHI